MWFFLLWAPEYLPGVPLQSLYPCQCCQLPQRGSLLLHSDRNCAQSQVAAQVAYPEIKLNQKHKVVKMQDRLALLQPPIGDGATGGLRNSSCRGGCKDLQEEAPGHL